MRSFGVLVGLVIVVALASITVTSALSIRDHQGILAEDHLEWATLVDDLGEEVDYNHDELFDENMMEVDEEMTTTPSKAAPAKAAPNAAAAGAKAPTAAKASPTKAPKPVHQMSGTEFRKMLNVKRPPILGQRSPNPRFVQVETETETAPAGAGGNAGASGTKAGASGTKAGASGTKAGASGTKAGDSGGAAAASGTKAGASGTKAGASGTKSGASGTKAGDSGGTVIVHAAPTPSGPTLGHWSEPAVAGSQSTWVHLCRKLYSIFWLRLKPLSQTSFSKMGTVDPAHPGTVMHFDLSTVVNKWCLVSDGMGIVIANIESNQVSKSGEASTGVALMKKVWYDFVGCNGPTCNPKTPARKSNVPFENQFINTNPPRDQSTCGSCWAETAIGAFEVELKKNNQYKAPLSVQQILDCVKGGSYTSTGCAGGTPMEALNYLKTHNVATAAEYPYVGKDQPCKMPNGSGPKGKGWLMAPSISSGTGKNFVVQACAAKTDPQCKQQVKWESDLILAVQDAGPFIIYVDAANWQNYNGGIFPPDKCSSSNEAGNHVVQLVGYGHENYQPYWLVKNSWGPAWGENGFIKLPMGVNACGLANYVGNAGGWTAKMLAAGAKATVVASAAAAKASSAAVVAQEKAAAAAAKAKAAVAKPAAAKPVAKK